jgi:PDZ domain-containing protein
LWSKGCSHRYAVFALDCRGSDFSQSEFTLKLCDGHRQEAPEVRNPEQNGLVGEMPEHERACNHDHLRNRSGWRTLLIAVVSMAAALAAADAAAQTAVPDSQFPLGDRPSSRNQNRSTEVNPDATLEIAPRSGAAAVPKQSSSQSSPGDAVDLGNASEQELPPLPTSGPPASMISNGPGQPPPYLGISVQRIQSRSTPGRDIEGLEIVSVDLGSPAEHAGLKGRGGMTKIGASGATAGAMLAPLDIALMPLLKKTGQLGQPGDLIVAIDDRRVTNEVDLQTALTESKPGDTIYLTVVRPGSHGAGKTIKVPVELGKPAPEP